MFIYLNIPIFLHRVTVITGLSLWERERESARVCVRYSSVCQGFGSLVVSFISLHRVHVYINGILSPFSWTSPHHRFKVGRVNESLQGNMFTLFLRQLRKNGTSFFVTRSLAMHMKIGPERNMAEKGKKRRHDGMARHTHTHTKSEIASEVRKIPVFSFPFKWNSFDMTCSLLGGRQILSIRALVIMPCRSTVNCLPVVKVDF